MSLAALATACTASARTRLSGAKLSGRHANRRHLTAEERANLVSGYHPPAIITASLGGAGARR